MKDEELLSRVEQLKRKTAAVIKTGLEDETAEFARWVESWISALTEETGKPKCKCCGSTKVRFADQRE